MQTNIFFQIIYLLRSLNEISPSWAVDKKVDFSLLTVQWIQKIEYQSLPRKYTGICSFISLNHSY